MPTDLRDRLHDAAGAPRFDVPVDGLIRRAERARRRTVAASVSAGLAVLLAGVGIAVGWSPTSEPTPPFIDPAPSEREADALEPDDATSADPAPDASTEGGVDETVEAEEVTAEPPAPGSLDGLRWLVNGPNWLRGDDNRVVHRTEPVLFGGVARDGSGGFAFTDEAGLWWRPQGADEPDLVRGDVVELHDIHLDDGAPLARTDIGLVALPSGELRADRPVGEPWGPAGEITAANGLTARLTELEATRTPEGTIDQVTAPVRLLVERDGEPLTDVVVGTEYQPSVRLHDFDGQRVLLTRTFEEPAMAPESIVFLDLACADCVEVVGTTMPVGVALVGEDVDWDGPVVEFRQELITPMVTDEGVDALPDGRHLLVDVEVADDGGSLTGDLAIWFSDPLADRAAAEDSPQDVPAPNGYHVRNRDPARLTVPVASDVAVTSVWFHSSYRPGLDPRPIEFEWFLAALRGEYVGDVRDTLRGSPWWVSVDGGQVVALDEQYVP